MQGRPAQPGARWWREKLRPTGLQFEGIAAPVKVFLRVFSAPPLDAPDPKLSRSKGQLWAVSCQEGVRTARPLPRRHSAAPV
jgi:hypothetical protein